MRLSSSEIASASGAAEPEFPTAVSARDRVVFELCAEFADACRAARLGGADRVEICSSLRVGGLTPRPDLIEAAIEQSGLPVYVLLRPGAETFVYSRKDFQAMAASLRQAREIGAAGVVFGFLNPDSTIAIEPTREMMDMAQPMETTFHRAFDHLPDQQEGLEQLIEIGIDRVLTSGGAPVVLTGADALGRLIQQAAGRIDVAVGGGLTPENAREVVRRSGARQYHGSLLAGKTLPPVSVFAEQIRSMIRLLCEGNPNVPAADPNRSDDPAPQRQAPSRPPDRAR